MENKNKNHFIKEKSCFFYKKKNQIYFNILNKNI